jgi:Family of unknown function (DUF6055)
MARRLWLTVSVFAVFGVLSAPALAARPGGLPNVASTAHFQAHYVSDPDDAAYTTQSKVLNVLAVAERAYAAYQSWGFATPVNDGDGKVDVYVADLSALDVLAYADTDVSAATSSGFIVVDVKSLDSSDIGGIISHELMHVVQFASWANSVTADHWLFEGEAEWAAAKFLGYPASLATTTGPSDLSLDCRDAIAGFQKCDSDGYIDGGYSRWPFFESLAKRYGASFVQSVFQQGSTGLSATNALAAAIGAKGGTLADVYGDWAVQQMAGTYGVASLDAKAPATYGSSVATGVKTATLPSFNVAVDHLATRYVKFLRGDGASDHPCFAATLTVTVTIPAGVTSRPFLYWNQKGSAPVELAVSGNTATATVPWDTCAWSANWAYLALPNATTTVDGADFTVATAVAVDGTTPASATSAPAQDPVYGGVTDVPTAEPAPTITVFGPLLLQVSSKTQTLRLIVHSNGDGLLKATLGNLSLGTPELRAGNNDLRFKLPKSLLSALRRSAATKNLLTLTPLSPSGAAGAPVTRRVTLKK